jgi:hypothetical protein
MQKRLAAFGRQARPAPPKPSRAADPELMRVRRNYVEQFNLRDWNTLRELIRADARLRVADAFAGRLEDPPISAITSGGRCLGDWRMEKSTVSLS